MSFYWVTKLGPLDFICQNVGPITSPQAESLLSMSSCFYQIPKQKLEDCYNDFPRSRIFPAIAMARPQLSRENSFSLPNFPGISILRNHPRGYHQHCPCGGYLYVSTACIVACVFCMLMHFIFSAQLLSHLQNQVTYFSLTFSRSNSCSF